MPQKVFPGESAMARRMRALDWSKTALGPVQDWPQSLRTSVSICLDCAFPIIVWWGSELSLLYNDEYAAILGPAKDPIALGAPGATVWPEIWHVVGPMLEQVLHKGVATRSRDLFLLMNRFGYTEETYFSFSYSPIRAENGEVGGVFCPVIETTQKVIAERRLRTLRDLAARCKGAVSESQAYRSAADVLAAAPHDVPFALLYRVDETRRTASLEATAGIETGTTAAPVTLPLDGDDPWRLGAVADSGRAELVEDLEARFPHLPPGPFGLPVRCALVLPVLLPGQERPRAILVAGATPARALDDDSRTFFGLIATQIASAVADARALEEERRRAEALAEIDRAKTTFFSNVSHEFRTPLTLMLGPLEDLLATPGALAREMRTTLTVAHRNALRLLKLVNTLLDFSRIESGRVDASYEPTDLGPYTAELASVFRSAVEKAGLRLVVDCPPLAEPAYVDRDMWEKVVLNLLSNAFKFTFDGEIAVSLRSTDGRVELSVRDTGVGIAPSDLPKVFQRFHRVKSARSRTHEGTGIGLALVQELVKIHGGEVAVESREGVGSTFTVSIPAGRDHLPPERIGAGRELAPTRVAASAFVDEALRALPPDGGAPRPELIADTLADVPPSHGARGAGARILVADDNADMREYVARLLARDYRVETVPDGAAALERIRTAPPDLVLTDVMMPGLDGFGLLAAIRSDERSRALPVVMLSARAGEESRIEGLEAGADDYLIKPFSARELLARVSSQLELARLRREAAEQIRYRGEQFETLLNQAPLGVYVVDADFRIREVNPIAAPVFGDIPGGVIGKDFADVIHRLWAPDYAAEVVGTFRRTLETGEPHVAHERAKLRIDRGVTEYYDWRVDRITLPDGSYGLVCYFRDVSEQVKARKAIEESREALREGDRRKDEFLATLAHELRTPLAPIRNGVRILRVSGVEGRDAVRVYEMMERQVDHMIRLVDDLMEVSRITRGKIELKLQHVEVASAVKNAIETTRPLLDAAGHELTVELPPEPLVLDADPVRVAQIFGNLLNNAAKYTPEGGRIRLAAERNGRDVVVTVKDNGVGIPESALPHVFDLFMQAERTYDRAQGGLGIGLTLVHRLVQMHGGSVTAASEGPGRGAEFVVRLPLSSRAAGVESDGDSRAPARVPHRVLVVDDNRDAAESLGMLLEFLGAEVKTAHDGTAALEILGADRPNVALLDIGMPGMDGYEVARRARLLPGGADVTLIALTGWGQEEDRRRSREAGIDHHLVKPVDLVKLEELLAGLGVRQ